MKGNAVVVIFGATGDLAGRKLFPALNELAGKKLLPAGSVFLGVGRRQYNDEEFRKNISGPIRERFYYQSLDTGDPSDYSRSLKSRMEKLDRQFKTGGRVIFYLAVPPSMYINIIEGIGQSGLSRENLPENRAEPGAGETENTGWRRIVVEKPFGSSYETALELNASLHRYFSEKQIYRIDHYLGKETVQNIMAFRFANGIFEPLWNRNYISYIEITAAENIGIEKRGSYYETAGAMRDMVQNHLLQLAAVAAMEPPPFFTPDAVRTETLKVFQSLVRYSSDDIPDNMVLGQYVESVIRGKKVKGYRQEDNVNPDSRTETYAALRIYIDNWRWGGVPFYLRTGKRLPARVSEIVIHFRKTPHRIFKGQCDNFQCRNQLILRIQPDEGVLLTFGMKQPGSGFEIINRDMDFRYSDIGGFRIPDAYERLLYDAMTGDSTLFTRADSVEECWRFIDPFIACRESCGRVIIHGYPAGTWGPDVADSLIGKSGKGWRSPCKNLTEAGNYCEL